MKRFKISKSHGFDQCCTPLLKAFVDNGTVQIMFSNAMYIQCPSIQTPNTRRLHDLGVARHPPGDEVVSNVVLPHLTGPFKSHFTEDIAAERHGGGHAGEAARVVEFVDAHPLAPVGGRHGDSREAPITRVAGRTPMGRADWTMVRLSVCW